MNGSQFYGTFWYLTRHGRFGTRCRFNERHRPTVEPSTSPVEQRNLPYHFRANATRAISENETRTAKRNSVTRTAGIKSAPPPSKAPSPAGSINGDFTPRDGDSICTSLRGTRRRVRCREGMFEIKKNSEQSFVEFGCKLKA